VNKYISDLLLKFYKPIWYFHLIPHSGKNHVWCTYRELSPKQKQLINYDDNYSCKILCDWDASYQAITRGIIRKPIEKFDCIVVDILPKDIYRFTRKYCNKPWLYITFFLRIIFFNNPFKEIFFLWKTKNIKKQDLFKKYYNHNEYANYQSNLIASKQFISIVIPTFNRYELLKKLLNDLEKQIYNYFEVIIIDQSNPFDKLFYNDINLKFRLIKQKHPGLWKARNSGILSAKSDYLLFLDDDSRLSNDWLYEHIKCLDYFDADISSGVSISVAGAKVPENYSYFRWSDQLDTGNVLIKLAVFKKCGLFDEQFENMRMGDGEFGVRAYLNGFKNISNYKSYRLHLKKDKGGLREIGHWDAFRSKKIISPKPIPSVLYYWRKYWGNKSALINCMITIPFSLTNYKNKNNIISNIFSLVLFGFVFPIIVLQVVFSWKISSNMISSGSKINKLD